MTIQSWIDELTTKPNDLARGVIQIFTRRAITSIPQTIIVYLLIEWLMSGNISTNITISSQRLSTLSLSFYAQDFVFTTTAIVLSYRIILVPLRDSINTLSQHSLRRILNLLVGSTINNQSLFLQHNEACDWQVFELRNYSGI